MSRPKNQKTDIQPLQLDEYVLVLAQLPDHWRTFYELLWATGSRVGEGLALLKGDLDDNGIWITSEKREDHLRVRYPLPDDLVRRLRVVASQTKTKRIFPYTNGAAWLALKKAAKKAGVRHVHPHLFRHGMGDRFIRQAPPGMGALDALRLLQGILRHASINSTMRYINPTDKDIEDALRRLNSPKKGQGGK